MSITIRSRGRLPHWERENGTYFITFRTAAAVSPEQIAAFRLSRYTPDEIRERVELALDGCDRGDILRGPAAEIVASSIPFGHNRNYLLDTWCVMPNHVHLLIRIPQSRTLAGALQRLKSFTAHQLKNLLRQPGAIWEREYFVRLLRPGQADTVRNYILNNPRKAKLSNWPWVGCIVAGETPALRKP
jgi:REP element-mobilizing transposase RayT